MKVTKKDILSIQANCSATFPMATFEEAMSTRSYAYQLSNSSDRPADVKRYSVSLETKTMRLTIKAVKA